MTKQLKIIGILVAVVLVALVATGIGTTVAIWTSSAPGSGTTVAPATDSSPNWNAWAKYFDGEIISEDLHTARLTTFHGDAYGLNLETVIIPLNIKINGTEYTVTEIGNQVFADSTLKELPTAIRISPQVERISTFAFANLPNLVEVEFGVDESGAGANCVLENYAFMMSENLAVVRTHGRALLDVSGAGVTPASSAFLGASASLTISAQ